MTCQRQGLQFNCDRKRNKNENEACLWSHNFSVCAFYYHTHPIESLVSLISDKKVEDAATSLQKKNYKVYSCNRKC